MMMMMMHYIEHLYLHCKTFLHYKTIFTVNHCVHCKTLFLLFIFQTSSFLFAIYVSRDTYFL